MSEETIFQKIDQKADEQIAVIMSEGKNKAEAGKSAILQAAKEKVEEINKAADMNAKLHISGQKQQAVLDARISRLNHKHELLDAIFTLAKDEMKQFSDEQFVMLYTRLIKQYSMTGNVVVRISNNDISRYKNTGICREQLNMDGDLLSCWGEILTKERGVLTTFTLDERYASIDGGVILCGEVYDVDLSYNTILREAFTAYEKEIADCLFENGENAYE